MRSGSRPLGLRSAAGLAATLLAASACGQASDAASDAPIAEHFRMIMLSVSPPSSYSAAVEASARERAGQLGVVLDIVRAEPGTAAQVQQLRDAINSDQYIGGFVIPVTAGELCEVGTNEAPDRNFMLAVTTTPICGRSLNGRAETWAPGTLTFVSGRQELSDFEQWSSYIRTDNPGRQKVLLLTPQPEVEPSRTAEAALRASEDVDPEFDVVDVVHTDGTADGAAEELQLALEAQPDTTIIASVRPDLTRAAARVAASRPGTRPRVYDFGGGRDVLDLIENRQVVMTRPQFPEVVGATAVQALYDARVGRTPISRYHSGGDLPAQAGPGAEIWAAVTLNNVTRFRAAGLGQY